MTWGTLKQSVLEHMFSYTKKGVVNTSTLNLDYTSAMPNRANEAFDELTDIKPTIKELIIVQSVPENIIAESGDFFAINRVSSTEDVEYTAVNPKSYYFECSGGYLDAYIEKENGATWDEIVHISEAGTAYFKAFSGLLTDDGTYRMRFSVADANPYSYLYRNVAFYAESCASASSIPAYSAYVKYDMNVLLASQSEPNKFKRLAAPSIVLEGGDAYKNTRKREKPIYYIEGDDVIYVDRDYVGQAVFYYEAKPLVITSATADATAIPLDDALVYAAAYYVAAMLYAEDSEYISARLLEQYENKKAMILQYQYAASNPEFTSESGW